MPADNPTKTNIPEERVYRCRILGTGTTPTKEVGPGITVTRAAAGRYLFTFAENPGQFVNAYALLGAATPGDVKGHTVTRDTPTAASSSANASVELSLWNASDAADDLQATEYMDVTFVYSEGDTLT